jgi:hypothetical protein
LAIIQKDIQRIIVIPVKIPMSFFTEIHMETLKTPTAKAILSKKNDARSIIIPDFKLYYRVYSLYYKNSMVLLQKQTCRLMESIEDPEINHRAVTI